MVEQMEEMEEMELRSERPRRSSPPMIAESADDYSQSGQLWRHATCSPNICGVASSLIATLPSANQPRHTSFAISHAPLYLRKSGINALRELHD